MRTITLAPALLAGLGWTSLGDSITVDYYAGAAPLSLYAGLVGAGSVHISGADVEALRTGGDENTSSVYYFFLDPAALPPQVRAQLQSVPEPSTLLMLAVGTLAIVGVRYGSSGRRR